MTEPDDRLITREDIEQGFREIQGEVSGQVDAARPKLLAGGFAAAIVLLFLVYALGRRVGRTKSTVVEIRRI